jgi:hypothetical protein
MITLLACFLATLNERVELNELFAGVMGIAAERTKARARKYRTNLLVRSSPLLIPQ